MIPWLGSENFIFPHPLGEDLEGIIAVGGDLHPQRIINAYHHGIFPWYAPEEPILWWFTYPRMILRPSELKISKSMRNVLNKDLWTIKTNTQFQKVIESCKTIERPDQETSWIDQDIIHAYTELHNLGYAHSWEVFENDELVAGLYGIALGQIFFGESMFTKVSNASKFAFIHMVKDLEKEGFLLIDCQQETPHLASLGARPIKREEFYDYIRRNKMYCLSNNDKTVLGKDQKKSPNLPK